MKRDGAKISVWQENIPDYQPVNNWNKDEVFDVLIVGGGITGLTTALLLQSQGKKCILAEARNIGFGTSGGTTAHLNTVVEASYRQVEKDFGEADSKLFASATREAIDLVEGLVTKYGIDCDFSYQPGYVIAENDEQAKDLDEISDAATRAGVMVSCTDQVPLPVPFIKACRFDMQAQFHPTKYLDGLAKAYEQEGGILLQQCIAGNTKHDEFYTADTSLGEIKAHKIVYATHIPPGINILHFRCAPYRSYACAFTLKSGEYPAGLIYDMRDPYNYYRSQTIDGKQYVVSGGFDHKKGHEKKTDQVFREREA